MSLYHYTVFFIHGKILFPFSDFQKVKKKMFLRQEKHTKSLCFKSIEGSTALTAF